MLIVAVVVVTSRYARRALDRLVVMEAEAHSNVESTELAQNIAVEE